MGFRVRDHTLAASGRWVAFGPSEDERLPSGDTLVHGARLAKLHAIPNTHTLIWFHGPAPREINWGVKRVSLAKTTLCGCAMIAPVARAGVNDENSHTSVAVHYFSLRPVLLCSVNSLAVTYVA